MKNIIFCLAVLLIAPFFGFSQTADEIIEKHIKALGGQKNWEAVKSMKITGQYTAYSKTKPFSDYKYNDEKYYSDRYENIGKVYEGYTGETAWKREDWENENPPRKVNSKELNVLEQKKEICTPFFNYKKKGYTVELAGKEDVEGTEAFVLKLTRPSKHVETWYIDAKTYLPIKQESDWTDSGWPAKAVSFFDDFREIEGVLIPFYTERTFGSRYRVAEAEKVEINVEIDQSIFEMPKSEEILKLKFLEGEWDVNFEVFTRRGTWYPLGSYPSKIDFSGNNILRENITYERVTPITKTIFYTFSSVSNKYEIAVIDDNSSTANLYKGGFNDTMLVVDNAKILLADSIQENARFEQYCIYRIKDDSFIIEVKRSRDQGATWQNGDKFTYTRKKEEVKPEE